MHIQINVNKLPLYYIPFPIIMIIFIIILLAKFAQVARHWLLTRSSDSISGDFVRAAW
jgi:hypothetical protein